MDKHFNTAGPSDPELHYLLNPLVRIDMDNIRTLIDQRRYFVLHAPRQTGKTTYLLALRDELNAAGHYAAVYANVEAGQAFRSDLEPAMDAIGDSLANALKLTLGLDLRDELKRISSRGTQLGALLSLASQKSTKPLLVFLDEVDALVGDTLISLLRQIRAGYTDRPKNFPQTIVLCGVRDVRDYRMTLSDGEVITGGSAFNIKAESLRLGDFSREDLIALY
jgi:ATPase family associated with various cellular activities (AAA)